MAGRAVPRGVPEVLRRHWAGLIVTVLSVVLVAAAVVAPGLRVADVRLQDGVVFAINEGAGLLGTVNTQIKDLASATTIAEQSFTVLQEGRTVVVKGASSNQVQSFDPTTGDFGGAISLPSSGEIYLNGGKIAVLSRLNGAVWFGDAASMLTRDFNKEKAQLDLGESALVTITTDGELIGLSLVDSQIVRLVNGQRVSSPVPMQLDASVANVQLSAVGNKAVVLDRTKQLIWFEGASKPLEMLIGSSAQLAAPVPALAHQGGKLGAVVATLTGLVGVTNNALISLSGAMPQGEVKAPVSARGCVYGVVGSKVVTSCPDASPVVVDIPELPTNAQLSLRVNGDNVILNDSRSGDVWLVTDGMRRISDWTKVTPAQATKKQQEPGDDTKKVNPNRTDKNRPPVAKDDQLTVRAGRSTALTILDNDSDPDGDIITVTSAPSTAPGVTLQLVRGGAGLQAVADAKASGTYTFSYNISDGRGGTSAQPGHVSLTVVSADQAVRNQLPFLFTKDAVTVAAGQKTQIRELLRWRDPEGDDMVLTNATLASGGDDEVSFTPDGTITFKDVGKATGPKRIDVTVSDGSGESAHDVLLLDSRKATDVAPVANGDFATATTNQEIEVSPLDNDQGVNLALASVDNPTPTASKFTVDYASRTFRFKAAVAGTYYVGYTVTNGRTSFGLVRIDVTDKVSENRPPVTTRDVVLLTHGGSVTFDPLTNDEDPDGDVLVLQTFSASGLTVTMRDRHLLTLSEVTALMSPVTITYWVSDGNHAAVPGTIVVIPSDPVGDVRPVAVADDINVRVGDAATVNPLNNDYSPVGLDLTLDAKLVDNLGGAWVDGDKIRFVAPAVPGRVTATYQIKDSIGRTASAVVRFNVISPDIVNQPPNPVLVTGRVISGTTQRIAIPLQGIDPNGDSVRLLGLASSPLLGRVLTVGPTYLEYEAFPKTTGTDSFTYSVIDAQGAKAVGEIRVGVVASSVGNTPPSAIQDVITTRPGKTLYIQPLANDSDSDGDKISLVATNPLSFEIPAEVVDGSAIQIRVPDQAKTWFGTYKIQDARGATTTGNVVITADPEAPLQPPKAFDDLVDAREVFGKDTVDVPVLTNDYDPDGLRADLTLTVPPYDTGGAAAAVPVQTPTGLQLRVPIGDKMKVIRYTITDADGHTASAFVTIPGRSDATPWLKDPNAQIEVVAGELRQISVAQYVSGTQGRNVILPSADKVRGAPGTGRRDSATELTYLPGLNDVGPAAITFEVVEDVDPSVTDARSATLTIRIKVLPRTETKTGPEAGPNGATLNEPPYAPTNIEIKAGKGEPPIEQNLQSLLADGEGDSIVVGGFDAQLPPGLHVTMQGSNIYASADTDVAKGLNGIVRVNVSDARGAKAIIPVSIVAVGSTRPLTVAVEDQVDANQGSTTPVPVTANDKSSLIDTTLTVISTAVESGVGEARVGDAGTVIVLPGKDFSGTMVVRYTVRDATGDAERNVDGRIVVTVKGRPSPPGTPVNLSVGDGKVTFEFTSSAQSGGSPIDMYNVTATPVTTGPAVTGECPVTTCTLTGLTNGVEYKLTVTAHNEVNNSDPSPESAPMMPNVAPDQPAAPTVVRASGRDGGKLVVTWTAPTNRGTPITKYDVRLEGGEIRTVDGSTFQMEWASLTNGTEYSFSVQAVNAAGPSGFSSLGHGHPSSYTSVPTAIVAQDGGAADGKTITVTWRAPASLNGDLVDHYELNWKTTNAFAYTDVADHSVAAVSDLGHTYSYTITGVPNNVNYYVAVRAVNAAGSSEPGVSAPAYAFPAPVLDPQIVPVATAGDQTIHVHMDKVVPPGGGTIVAWVLTVYKVNSGQSIPTSPATVPVDANGVLDYDFTVPYANNFSVRWTVTATPRASGGGSVVKQGAESDKSNQVTPHGKPGAPTLTLLQHQGTNTSIGPRIALQYEVQPGSSNGNDPAQISFIVRTPEGTQMAVAANNTVVVLVPYGGGTVTAQSKANDSGLLSDVAQYPTGKLVWADPVTKIYHLEALSENQLKCTASIPLFPTLSGDAVGTSNAPGPGTNYTFDFGAVPGAAPGRTVTLKCGPPSTLDKYAITITL